MIFGLSPNLGLKRKTDPKSEMTHYLCTTQCEPCAPLHEVAGVGEGVDEEEERVP